MSATLTSVYHEMKSLLPWWLRWGWKRSSHRIRKQLQSLFFYYVIALELHRQTSFVIYPQEYCSDQNELPLEFCNSRAEGLPSFTGIIAALNLGEGTLDMPFESKEGTRLPFITSKYSLNSTGAWPVAISMLSAWVVSPVFGGSGRMWWSPTSYPRFYF